MIKGILAAGFAVLLSGCATFSPAVPEGYVGPVAIIKDSVKSYSASKADFFYLSGIDERKIEDSRSRTLRANHGRGFNMTPALVERNVPAKPSAFRIVGRTEYAAPILALTNTVYQVVGTVTFTPEAYKHYVVRGILGENYSAVWVEEEATNLQIGEKIELRGTAKLGILEK